MIRTILSKENGVFGVYQHAADCTLIIKADTPMEAIKGAPEVGKVWEENGFLVQSVSTECVPGEELFWVLPSAILSRIDFTHNDSTM